MIKTLVLIEMLSSILQEPSTIYAKDVQAAQLPCSWSARRSMQMSGLISVLLGARHIVDMLSCGC